MSEQVSPHALDAERAVLGALLINRAAFDHVASMLRPASFFRRAHGLIYAAIMALAAKGAEIDLLTVKTELQARGVVDEIGGVAYLASLTDGVPRSENGKQYAAIVVETSRLRTLIKLGNDLSDAAHEDGASSADLVERADRALLEFSVRHGDETIDVRTSGSRIYERIEGYEQTRGQLRGLETGFASINDHSLGWRAGDMIVIGARPSIGKTSFVLETGMAMAAGGRTVGMFSLEMSGEQIENRMLSQISGVPSKRIEVGSLTPEEHKRLAEALAVMSALPILIDDRADQTIGEVRSRCRRWRAEHGLSAVIVDYVQLMRGTGDRRGTTRNEELTEISRGLKKLAKELNVPVFVLSQLTRASSTRADPEPQLSDLRESGSFEQDADVVAFLHRKNHEQSGTTRFIVRKGRTIGPGECALTFDLPTQHFTDGGAPDPAEEKPARPAKNPAFWRGKKR